MSDTTSDTTSEASSAGLAQAVLDAESARQDLQAQASRDVVLADHELPGVGGDRIGWRDGVKAGGMATLVTLVLLGIVDQLDGSALAVLAPNIRDSLHVGSGTVVTFSAATGAFLAIGALPLGALADRAHRPRIIGWATAAIAAAGLISGLAVNAFMLFMGRLVSGVAGGNRLPVQGALAADAFPIGLRGRVASALAAGTRLGVVVSPAVVGGIAALAGGGTAGWRWAYGALAVVMVPLAVLAARMPEVVRGRQEMAEVDGEVVTNVRAAPVSLAAAFGRLRQVRTLRTLALALAALGFGLVVVPVLQNLYLADHFGLGPLGRGVVAGAGGLVALIGLPVVGPRYDALYRRDPVRAVRLLGLLVLPIGVVQAVQYAVGNKVAFALIGTVPTALAVTASALALAVIQSVVPARLRGAGLALASVYSFGLGATVGGLLAAGFTRGSGPATAVVGIALPVSLVAGLLVLRGSGNVRGDLSRVVVELREELEEHRRRQAAPDEVAALQVSGIDFSYGHVQVLFEVGFELRKGEVLALLGTNGAGKSTLLRVVAGLGSPRRGVVRLDGVTVTYVGPEQRAALGVHLLPGGKGVFPQMTVRENLEMATYLYRGDGPDRERRIERAYDLFGILGERRDQPAALLSGGQQQMLALAMTLVHDPTVLLIDELSLGLSPIVVQELLGTIETLKAQGMTIVVVEQSLNVALSIADRAVFLEKGQVRFAGTAQELAEHEDLALQVFLGADT